MKKILLQTLLLTQILPLYSQELELQSMQFRTENDGDFGTDRAYTYGSDISVLYHKKQNQQFSNAQEYISFSYAQKIYTPNDIEAKTLLQNDRPYAGYMYVQMGLYTSYKNELDSFIFQLGMVGPSTKMEDVQKFVHSLIGSPQPKGWDNQLKDEPTFQVNYNHKKYIDISQYFKKEAALIPSYGFDLGNASTKLYSGCLFRYGTHLPKDYGSYVINNGDYNHIPRKDTLQSIKKWRISFNLSLRVNAIARDIFLDGNTFKDSHSVEKNNFTLQGGYGLSLRYGHYSFDYLREHTTKEFKGQDYYSSYGSFIFAYNY